MQGSLDTLDQHIINELRRDGRETNTEIARRLGASEATVRYRIQRLISEGIIQVVAVVHLSRLGYDVDARIGIHCDAGRVVDVARALGQMEEVRYVAAVSGRYDLEIFAFFRSRDELFSFLTDKVGKIPGVQRTETLHVLRVFKRDYGFFEVPTFLGPRDGEAGRIQTVQGQLGSPENAEAVSGQKAHGVDSEPPA